MKVIKQSGHVVDFNREKLKRSLLKSGAKPDVVDDVLRKIESQLFEGVSTKHIYKLAFSLLKKSANAHAARYNLKTAIQKLGPAGFYFEKYVARLYKSEGYLAKTNMLLQGKCVSHEIDIIVKKENVISMIECKFHSRNDKVTDVKVPLYILSRYNDIKNQTHMVFSQNDTISNCFIVTNNRFTSDAITFAICSELQLLSWDYPKETCLRKRIDQDNLYPVTCLTTLTMSEKDKLLVLDIVLANDLMESPESLRKIGVSEKRIRNVLKETTELCNYILR
jgi:hypothetical protein